MVLSDLTLASCFTRELVLVIELDLNQNFKTISSYLTSCYGPIRLPIIRSLTNV